MTNIKSIINMHNKEVIMGKKTEAVKCNSINKRYCPLSNQCQMTNLIYKEKTYYGTSEGTFKQRYGNHKPYFNHI